jgi:sulfonate transport system ATP-binding protein
MASESLALLTELEGVVRDDVRSQPATVECHQLTKAFGERVVLSDVTFSIAPGEFVALLGRSGSGKSSLLRILAGLDPDVGGQAVVPTRRAVVFQDARLLPWARVLSNVTLGLSEPHAKDLGLALLAEVGLEGRAYDWPKTLSGGEAQRAALARALIRAPRLLLLDEPFGALDALTRIRMHQLLQRLCDRHNPSVLLVTHDVDEAIQLADRVLVLANGEISLDLNVDIPGADRRSHDAFVELRTRLLKELGVVDDAGTSETASSIA